MKKLTILLALIPTFICLPGQPFQLENIFLQPRLCGNLNSVVARVDIEGTGGTLPYTFTLNGASPTVFGADFADFITSDTTALIKGVDNSSPKPQQILVNINSLISSFNSLTFRLMFTCNGVRIIYDTTPLPQAVTLQGPNFNESQPLDSFGSFPSDPTAGLRIGHYTLTFTPLPTGNSACDKPIVFEFDITQSPLSIRAKNDAVCSTRENTGSLTVTAQGGVPPFTYTISGPSGNQFQGPTPNRRATFSGLANGDYIVAVTDSNTPTPCIQRTTVRVNSRKCKRQNFCATSC